MIEARQPFPPFKRVTIEYVYDSLTCSICGRDLMICSHLPGKAYAGRYCVGIIDDIKEIRSVAIDPRGLR